MARTYSSRTKQAIVAAACAVTMALSGFSPKNETILGPGAARAQGSMPSFPSSSGSLPSQYVPSIPYIPWYTVPDYGSYSRPKSRMELKIEEKAGETGLRSEDAGTQARAARELVKMGKSAVPALTDALSDGNASERRLAARALGEIAVAKPKDPSVIDIVLALAGLMNDGNKEVKECAAKAIEDIKKARAPRPARSQRRTYSGRAFMPSDVNIQQQIMGAGHFPY